MYIWRDFLMLNLLISPGRYISGYDNIKELGKEIKKLGSSALVLVDENILQLIGEGLSSVKESVASEQVVFQGECCHEEIDRIADIIKFIISSELCVDRILNPAFLNKS
jgi:glycerol dehydrogenase-like iron-containing ADH family enzyme